MGDRRQQRRSPHVREEQRCEKVIEPQRSDHVQGCPNRNRPPASLANWSDCKRRDDMNRCCHRSIEEEYPPRNSSTWDAAIESGKPSDSSYTGTWGIQPGGHQQWIKDCLVARFPQNRPKSGYLRTDGKVQERYDRTSRNRMDDPTEPNRPYPDRNYPGQVQSRRPT